MDRILELAAGGASLNSPLPAFVLTSLIIEMTPGPNMAYLAVLGASHGRLAGFSAVLGVALGLAILGIAVGLGGGSLLLNSRVFYESLRWAGALYLCWLALDSWREARQPIEAVPHNQSSHFTHFRRGLVTNLLNPKAALFFIAVLPEFIQGPPSAHELAILVSIYVGVATLVHSLIVVLAGGLQAFFAAPRRREMAGNFFAVLLLAIAVWLFVSGRR
ncbi:LysE family transporter [Bradyrhizobium sp. CSA112]|nr:LysE family transporter [Bradyrhizobium sp. CSA112]